MCWIDVFHFHPFCIRLLQQKPAGIFRSRFTTHVGFIDGLFHLMVANDSVNPHQQWFLVFYLFVSYKKDKWLVRNPNFIFFLLSYFLLSIEDVPYTSNIMNNHKYSKNCKINIHEILDTFKLILFLLIKSFTRFPQFLHQIFPNSILIYQITSIKCVW